MNGIVKAILLREAQATTRISHEQVMGVTYPRGVQEIMQRTGADLTGGTSYYTPLPTPEELIEWMTEVEMTPRTLADRLGVQVEYVNEILSGQEDPPIHTWFALGKIIGMTNKERSVIAQRNYAVAPGEFVQEWLDDTKTDVDTLAFKLGVAPSYVNQVLAGEVAISDALASALAEVTGIRASSWQAWETLYQRDTKRITQEKLLATQLRGGVPRPRRIGATNC